MVVSQEQIQKELGKGKPYIIAILKKGKKFVLDKAQAESMRAKHFEHLFQLRAEGKVSVIFGTRENGEVRSIELFQLSDRSEVERLVSEDPAVQAEHFAFELLQMTGLPGDMVK
ncbi:MAG TPA: hypothetical protein VMM58_08820 [Bacteroidota bacterium]|nr:hypothetical protein [Bacteroidota bacterium]